MKYAGTLFFQVFNCYLLIILDVFVNQSCIIFNTVI